MTKLSQLARSPQGRRMADKAVKAAKDPKTRAQIDSARRKLASRRGGGGGRAA